MLVMDSGILMYDRFVHFRKAYFPILVTLFGIMID